MTALITLLFGVAALFSAAFGFMELRMLARFLKHRAAIRAVEARNGNGANHHGDDAFPTVTIQIPLFNERTSAEQVVRAAAAQDYPLDRFDIQVLDDSTDETSAIVARVADEVRGSGVAIRHLHRKTRTGYKAGALAEGLERSKSEFVAVFDADFLPESGFLTSVLRRARPFHDPDVAFVQARWAWGARERKGWLNAVLALLLDRHFRVQKPIRAHLGNVTTFNGSGGVWRRAAIDDAGGWTADTLTEDLDLSFRCALAGWRGHYLQDVSVPNELPRHMRAFKLQQRRWAKGTAQCLRKLTGRIMRSGERVADRWEEMFLLAGYAIHPLLFLALILWPWAVLYVDRTVFWVLQGFMAVGVTGAALSLLVTIRERDGRLSLRALRETIASLCVGIGMMVNNTVGQLQGFFASGGEFLRTPKGNGRPTGNGSGPMKSYRTPLHWTFLVEIGVIVYCLGSAVLLVQRGEGLWALAMVLWAACLALVVQQQLIDS
jgi:cellulose synthase/poly-beta-1,6-N-acetylglucosamine synthase-like glycosyltransferase